MQNDKVKCKMLPSDRAMGIAASSILLVLLFLGGCMPAFTSCKGDLEIRTRDGAPHERFVVVSFWDYPTTNAIGGKRKRGEVVINEVLVIDSEVITVDFPTKVYTAIWTPALGTQHIAPQPGVMVFNANYLSSWNIGGTETYGKSCCGPPKTRHEFTIDLVTPEEFLLDRKDDYSSIEFFEEFLDRKKDLVKKMRKCRGLTEEEKVMVLEKLSETARTLGISEF